jgi:hypothetical protein
VGGQVRGARPTPDTGGWVVAVVACAPEPDAGVEAEGAAPLAVEAEGAAPLAVARCSRLEAMLGANCASNELRKHAYTHTLLTSGLCD